MPLPGPSSESAIADQVNLVETPVNRCAGRHRARAV
jgi:hypothetical protein